MKFPSRRQWIDWLSLALLIALVVGPLLWFAWLLLFTTTFRVQTITIVDARPNTAESIRQSTSNAIGKNILFLDTQVTEQHILSSVPQVRNIRVTRKLPDTIKIIVQEKTPVLLLLSSQHYYFVDQQGIAYEEARLENLPGVILPVVKNTDSTAKLQLGTTVVDPSFIDFIQQIQQQIPTITDAQVAEIRIPSLSAREVHFLLNNNWLLRFDSTRQTQGQLNILRQVLEQSITPEQKKTLQYIDLRIPNRVYYRTVSGT